MEDSDDPMEEKDKLKELSNIGGLSGKQNNYECTKMRLKEVKLVCEEEKKEEGNDTQLLGPSVTSDRRKLGKTENLKTDREKIEGANRSCPIYFGIKSYLHDFYDPPDKDIFESGEFIQTDNFQFVVEPGKHRWGWCWLRAGLWTGVNLVLLGVIALLVGHLTPPRDPVVTRKASIEVLDRWAMAFNRRLEVCRLAGLTVICCGTMILLLAVLIKTNRDNTYCAMSSTPKPYFYCHTLSQQFSPRIPLTGSIKSIQPTLTPSAP